MDLTLPNNGRLLNAPILTNKERAVSPDKQLRRIKRKKDKFIEASVPRKVASPVYISYGGVRSIRPIF